MLENENSVNNLAELDKTAIPKAPLMTIDILIRLDDKPGSFLPISFIAASINGLNAFPEPTLISIMLGKISIFKQAKSD